MSRTAKRVVLDTNQIVGAGTRWLVGDVPEANWNLHRRMLVHVAAKHVGLYCSEIIDEYIEKLTTKGHPPDRIRKLLAVLDGTFEEVALTTTVPPVAPPDLDDAVFILCCLDGKADYLISEDSDLLRLDTAYPSFAIGRCAEFMEVLGVPRDPT